MLGLRNALRDWWRGFTNEDLASALRKTEGTPGKPGAIVWLSPGEFKAWLAWNRLGNTHPVPKVY